MDMFGKAWLGTVFAFVAALIGESLFACQPCPSTLNLEQSLKKADLVIIGKRIDFDAGEVAPQNIQVRVLKVLKGKLKGKQVAVRSWYGMCPYGIIVDDQTYLMVLTKSSDKPGMFESVDSGCSVRTLRVKSERVIMGERSISLEEFERRYKLKVAS